MENTSASGGIGFTGSLLLLFIGLKLGGVIHWSWWWVLSPIWVWIALFAVALICLGLFLGVVWAVDKIWD